MLPIQIHLRYFNLSSLIHLMVILIFFSDLTLGDLRICMMYFQTQGLHPGISVLPQQCQYHNGSTVSYSASITATIPTGYLPISMSQYRDKMLAISPIQQCLKPAGQLLHLQTFSFSSFCDLLQGNPYNHFLSLMLPFNMTKPSVNRAFCFSLSDNLLCSGASSARYFLLW